jgi:lantibiotic modifying enzyme
METYKFIFDFELQQMLNGDIPIFSLNSLDNALNCNESFKIFEFNCIENIKRRIDAISPEHKKEQLEFINRWINIKGN